jgi:hypothetical protein
MSAAAPIYCRTALGRLVDITQMRCQIDWQREIAGPLSRIVRFAGQLPDEFIFNEPNLYSVAEHSVRGGDAIRAEALAEDPEDIDRADVLAFAFLMHDDHEAFTGDATRPFVRLAARFADDAEAGGGAIVVEAIRRARDHISAAVHHAAGLPWPLPGDIAAVVADMDDRMCATEQLRWWGQSAWSALVPVDPELRHCRPLDIIEWRSPRNIDGRPWSPDLAAARWIYRFNDWRPAVRRVFRQEAPT